MQNRTQRVILAMAGLWVLLAAVSARAQTVTTTVPVDYTGAVAAAVNLATNKIYVASPSGSNAGAITVINGATNSYNTFQDSNANGPQALAVNPLTNKIYVANRNTSNVTVVDGSTDSIKTTLGVGNSPLALAVNPQTNIVYVANNADGTVSVINGSTDAVTATVTVGTSPQAVAVNPVTNKIYVANSTSGTVSVIDGATNTVVASPSDLTYVPNPGALAVDPVHNQTYVVGSNYMMIIDGTSPTYNTSVVGLGVDGSGVDVVVNPVTNTVYTADPVGFVTVIAGATAVSPASFVTTLGVGSNPSALALDPVSNKIYVANYGSANVSVIDGATNSVTTVADTNASGPYAVTVNPVTNKIYVANNTSYNVTVLDGADYQTTTVSDSTYPTAVAVNPATNTAYVADYTSNSVTVITGINYYDTVPTGTNPTAVAVNPVTNKIYVANSGSNDVTVIDGATDTPTTVVDPNAVNPTAVAVNPVSNTIYVANNTSNNVTVINGATNATTTVSDPTASGTTAVAVNSATNKIYVANSSSDTVTVIDGATNSVTASIPVGTTPVALAVEPATNMIYVANYGSNNVSVIDGSTDTLVTTVADTSAINPTAVDINHKTNMIYVANYGVSSGFSSVVTVINGADNSYTSVSDPSGFAYEVNAVAVNQATNKIYVSSFYPEANDGTANVVTVVDGATNSVRDVIIPTADAYPVAVAVNPFTNMVYVADSGTSGTGQNTTIITEQQVQTIPILTSVTALPGNLTPSLTPTFSFTATNNLTPPAPIDNLLFQVGTWQGAWLPGANLGGGSFSGTVASLRPGLHVIYAYSTEGEEATSTSTGVGTGPLIGNITAYGFLVAAPEISPSPVSLTFSNQAVGTNSTAATVTLTNSGTAPLTITAFTSGGSNPGDYSETENCTSSSPIAAGGTCTVNVTFTPTAVGARTATLTITDNKGDVPGSQQTMSVTGTAIQATTTASVVPSANPSPYLQPLTLTATVTPPGSGTPSGTATFEDGTTTLCSNVVLSAAQAQCTTSTLAIGLHSITAVYSGDTNFQGITSPALSLTVSKELATVTLSNLTQTYTGSALTPTVVTNPAGLSITWTGAPQTNAGPYPVTATVNDATYQGSASGTFTINPAATTTTVAWIISGTPGETPPTLGQTLGISFSVSVSPPGGGTIPGTDTVTVTDSTGASCTGTVAAGGCGLTPKAIGGDVLTATFNGDTNYSKSSGSMTLPVPIVQAISLTGLTATTSPDTPTTMGVTLTTPATTQLNGTLTLSFVSNAAGTGAGYIDPMTCFIDSNNQCVTQLNFTIPVGASAPTLPNNGTVQQGTTAGTITVTLTALTAGGTSVLPQPAPSLSVVVAPIAPVIKSVSIINQSATGFSIQVTAFSTPRDLATAQFTFVAAAGSDLNGSSPSPVALADTAQAYFSSANGALGGGTFVLTVPFSFSGDTSALGSVGVAVSNSVGASASASQTF